MTEEQPHRVSHRSHSQNVEAPMYPSYPAPLSWRVQSFDGERVTIETETGSIWLPVAVLEAAVRCLHLDGRERRR